MVTISLCMIVKNEEKILHLFDYEDQKKNYYLVLL